MRLGFLGLGKMGSRMASKLLKEGHSIIVWNRSENVVDNFKLQLKEIVLQGEVFTANSIEEVVKQLEPPRILWLMLPQGEATKNVLDEVEKYIEKGDIVIDGANAYYKDTEERYKHFTKKGIRFLGVGVSGGVVAGEQGYPFMVGGDKSAYEHITPILDSLSKPGGGHEYFGTGGAGHFVKMVHNGIEYGQMQAIGEGFGVLDKSPYNLDLVKVASIWQKGTIVSSFLIDRAYDALKKNPKLSDIEGVIDATGEALWTVEQGKKEGVPVENIEQSLDFRKRSQTDPTISRSFAARMVAALRREFGGHKVKEKNIE